MIPLRSCSVANLYRTPGERFLGLSPCQYLADIAPDEHARIGREAPDAVRCIEAMKRRNVSELTAAELVKEFVKVTLAQDEAELHGQSAKYNRLFKQMMDVTNELQIREGDQRTQLVKLYVHANFHVRVQAATLTLAVAPKEARAQLQSIAESHRLPYAGDAGMCLWNLDRGVFKPT